MQSATAAVRAVCPSSYFLEGLRDFPTAFSLFLERGVTFFENNSIFYNAIQKRMHWTALGASVGAPDQDPAPLNPFQGPNRNVPGVGPRLIIIVDNSIADNKQQCRQQQEQQRAALINNLQ
ncbi:uncharacterized protein LOC127012502 [Drosophila biarmipes]|uniref:uncharacterized protein LOC127012502 n=1 Tax=Drosophila biarmipes TaxID=125945 RepID=UPI0021CCCA90|nr:uncharacterized protein LOC127012502 [Drosophila biarmipes]